MFASIKIITIVGLLFMAFILFLGGGPHHDRIGFRYWKHPGAMNEYLVPGARGRFCGFLKSFVNACFAFSGSEVICVAVNISLSSSSLHALSIQADNSGLY